MPTVLRSLTKDLDREMRVAVNTRVTAIEREFNYLRETQNARYTAVAREGWGGNRLSAIAALNAFYQLVIGPLASSARERTGVLGDEIPILYGELIRFDGPHARQIRAAYRAFLTSLSDLPVALDLLTANRAEDIVFRLYTALNSADHT